MSYTICRLFCLLQAAEAEEPEEGNDDVTFTDQDIGQPEAVTHAQNPPPQNPPLPTSLPPMPGGPPGPMQFPGAYLPQPAVQVPPLPAARSHDALVQDFKDLLLESKVCQHLTIVSTSTCLSVPRLAISYQLDKARAAAAGDCLNRHTARARTSSLIDQLVQKIGRCKVCTISSSWRLLICLSTAVSCQLVISSLKCPHVEASFS